jgi:hypothetical protein
MARRKKQYGCLMFLLDVFMICILGPFAVCWIAWIIIRQWKAAGK